ncbi:MAG TPA: DUF1475 family protein [Opitutaceae bacterium]|jgi:hypothetical protein|nr:DUF1475 family protein [Opitutaceae bacterium]
MIKVLRVLFVVILASMLWVTTWASLQCPLFGVPRVVATHPWFIATMFDAYWGFVTFYVWVAYRETSWVARIAWLLAILALGNIAMSTYCLAALTQVPADGKLSDVLISRRKGRGWLGIILAVIGVGITVAAAMANPASK